MLALAALFFVALTSPASAEPISVFILTSIGIAATKTAVFVTTLLLTAAFSVATSLLQTKLFSAKPKKTAPTNIDSSINVTTREALAPRRLVYGRTRLGGTIVFIGASDNNLFLHLVIAFCEGPIDAFETIYFNDTPVVFDGSGLIQTAPYNTNGVAYVFRAEHLGEENQAADNTLPLYFPNGWGSDYKLSGVAYLYVRLQWDATVFSTGLPNISAVIRGQKVYDPRTGSSYWTDNAALCIRDYLLRPHTKGGVGAAPDEISEPNFITQANICDEDVAFSGGSENRYTLNGVIQMNSENSPQGTLESMLTSCAGIMPWTSGVFYLLVGAWRTPTVTITDEMLIGPLKVQPRRQLREQFNAVKGSFVNPAARYEAADYPAITSSVFEDEDGGAQIFRDLTLEFTQSAAMAQRIAKIELYRSREPITIQAVCGLFAYQVVVGDVVKMTHARYGWDEKPFECVNWRWTVVTSNDAPSLAIELTLRETSSAVYDWTASEEQLLAAAPATSLPNWTNVGGVLSLTLTAGSDELITAGDGTIVSRIKASWTASADAFVSRYEIRWKRNTDVGFGVAATVGRDDAPVYYISPVEDGLVYVVEVRAASVLGATSAWTSATVTVVGKTEPPDDITSIRITEGLLTWDYPNPPADLAGFLVRYQTGSYVFWPSAIAAHSGLLSSGQFDASALLSGTVTLMVKAIDTSGNESANAAVIIVNLGDHVVDNVILDYDLKASGFPDTIVSGSISGGDLVGDSTTLYWNTDLGIAFYTPAQSLFWPSDNYSDIEWSFSYVPGESEMGSTMSISSIIDGAPWSIFYRESGATIHWTGSDINPAWTDDGALVWAPDGDLQPWPGSVTARGTRYDFEVSVNGGPLQPRVSAFDLIFDVPDIMEVLGDVAVLSAGTTLPITKTYRAVTAVNLTVQAGLGGAVTARVDVKSPSGILVSALNAAGATVDATVDAIVQGY